MSTLGRNDDYSCEPEHSIDVAGVNLVAFDQAVSDCGPNPIE